MLQQYISTRLLNETPAHLIHLKPREGILRAGALIGVEANLIAPAVEVKGYSGKTVLFDHKSANVTRFRGVKTGHKLRDDVTKE